jgi:hypothetical protein
MLSTRARAARRATPLVLPAVVVLVALLAAPALWTVAAGRVSGGTAAGEPTRLSRSAFEEQTGIRVVRVAVTGGGGLVDLRYQVIDTDKAEVVHSDLPKLIDERTGQTIDALFMGHSHGSDPKAGYTYPLLFVNRQGLVERGGAVSVVVGDSRLQHVAVG